MSVKPIPDGYHSITPYLVVNGAAKVLDFVKQAFGATEIMRMPGPNGTIGHAEVRIGDSMVMMGDAGSEHPAQPAMLLVYVPDVDEVFQRALAAGAKSEREPADQFYGDRMGGVIDSGGNRWYIATHIEDVTPEEIERRIAELARKGATP